MIKQKVGIWPRECARTIENIRRIQMDVARASGDEMRTKSVFERNNSILIEKSRFLEATGIRYSDP